MSSRRLELIGSLDPQPLLDTLRDQGVPDIAEHLLLQDCAEASLDLLLRKSQQPRELEALRLASIRMAHLLQTSCLALRRLELDEANKALAREALEYQLAYMHSCLRRSMASFD
ncbi:hypothetical protein CCOS865_03346 [Pseudomonas reidholzensis]|uniref:Uncharacterized protein n=1 Tax=Pseudomonas reidholzensis TaxID=1785162 RepID=A0A383RVG6_9PSED|nr:hypothetical protein [Pseudomonas reidholzensis]SYX91077.1 hypothetical protein CCOS865_03346 [Pseudomonas reidholzensis]